MRITWAKSLLSILLGFILYNFFVTPKIDSNPSVTPKEVIGIWRDQENTSLTLTAEKYWFGNDKTDGGSWHLEDWNLVLSKNGRYRIIKVDDRLQIIRGAKGGELIYYPSFVQVD